MPRVPPSTYRWHQMFTLTRTPSFSLYTCGNQAYIDWNTWQHGGTFITNFSKDKFCFFEKALQQYHDISLDSRLYLCSESSGHVRAGYGGSLHIYPTPIPGVSPVQAFDLSHFWSVYRIVDSNPFVPSEKKDIIETPEQAYDRAMGVLGK